MVVIVMVLVVASSDNEEYHLWVLPGVIWISYMFLSLVHWNIKIPQTFKLFIAVFNLKTVAQFLKFNISAVSL
jgi:hypothetical protein